MASACVISSMTSEVLKEAADAEVFDDEVFEEKEITSPVRVERRFDIRRAEY